MAADYIVRGRSIDGTVYWDGHGWCSHWADAKRMSFEEACRVQDLQREANLAKAPDDKVGRIVID